MLGGGSQEFLSSARYAQCAPSVPPLFSYRVTLPWRGGVVYRGIVVGGPSACRVNVCRMKPILVAAAIAASAVAPAAPALADTDMFVGPTGYLADFPTYAPAITSLYLDRLGDAGTAVTLNVPDTYDFGPSVQQGEQILLSNVEGMWNAGQFSTSDPLVLDGYSQGASIISGDEAAFASYGIPEGALKIVLEGNTSDPFTGILAAMSANPVDVAVLDAIGWGDLVNLTTPDNLYQTTEYTVAGDGFADYTANNPWGDWIHMLYPSGLSEAAINAAPEVTQGLTTYVDIPAPSDLFGALFGDLFAALGVTV